MLEQSNPSVLPRFLGSACALVQLAPPGMDPHSERNDQATDTRQTSQTQQSEHSGAQRGGYAELDDICFFFFVVRAHSRKVHVIFESQAKTALGMCAARGACLVLQVVHDRIIHVDSSLGLRLRLGRVSSHITRQFESQTSLALEMVQNQAAAVVFLGSMGLRRWWHQICVQGHFESQAFDLT